MAKNSRKKGKSGELELANLINDQLGQKYLIRNLDQTRDGGHDLDIDQRIHEHDDSHIGQRLESMAIEVKRHHTCKPADIRQWWGQAVMQAERKKALPVLFYRGDRENWRCMFPIFKQLDMKCPDNCVTMSLPLFCQLVREPDLIASGLPS